VASLKLKGGKTRGFPFEVLRCKTVLRCKKITKFFLKRKTLNFRQLYPVKLPYKSCNNKG
jgi:hypothetical protein